jgi:hypothetical protein
MLRAIRCVFASKKGLRQRRHRSAPTALARWSDSTIGWAPIVGRSRCRQTAFQAGQIHDAIWHADRSPDRLADLIPARSAAPPNRRKATRRASRVLGRLLPPLGSCRTRCRAAPLMWRLARRSQFSSMRWSPDPTRSPACQKAKAARFADATRRQRKRTPSPKPPAARPCRRRRGLHRGPAPAPRAADFPWCLRPR